MTRTSRDIYRTEYGKLIAVACYEKPPANAKLWRGYDYEKQYWVFDGKRINSESKKK